MFLETTSASEIPAAEASDRKESPQVATKMHDGFDLRGIGAAQPFFQKGHLTILGQESCLVTIDIFMVTSQVQDDGLDEL